MTAFRRWWPGGQFVLLGLAIVSAGTFARAAWVRGESMAPTLADGQLLLVESASYRFRRPARGDVVVVRLRTDQWLFAELAGGQFVKRVVGLPGDAIEVRQGQVRVNGRGPEEPYASARVAQDIELVVVPPGAYYLLGDNRAASDDSRVWGPVPHGQILGRAWLALWPLGRGRVL
jgi:signal peptidase I